MSVPIIQNLEGLDIQEQDTTYNGETQYTLVFYVHRTETSRGDLTLKVPNLTRPELEIIHRTLWDFVGHQAEAPPPRKLTRKELADAVRNPAYCPYCHKEGLNGGSLDFVENSIYQPMTCQHCGSKFAQSYTLQNIIQ